MKKQWSLSILVSSIGLMCLLYACSTLQSTGTADQAIPTVEIDKEIHFLTPEGEDVMVAPGEYEVRAEKEGLRLIAEEGADGESMVIDAQSTNHQEKITAPTTLSFSEKEDEKVIVLLLPDGKGWEAQGSYSGVISRAAPRRRASSSAHWPQALSKRNRIPAKPPLSLAAVSVRYSETKKTYRGGKSRNTWRLPVSDTLPTGTFTFEWSGYQVGAPSPMMRKPSVKLLINGKATKSPQMKSARGGNLMTSVNLSFARANTWPKTVKLEITNGKKKWESAATKVYANAMSYYSTVLHPIFSHDRCTTCHTLGTRQAIVAMHQERIGVDSYPDVPGAIPHNPDFCGGCHNIPAGSSHTDLDLNNEWFSPDAVQGINWKGWSAGRVCAKVTGPFTNKDGVVGPPVDLHHHFHDDPRIIWAVISGWVPFNRPDLAIPIATLKNNREAWFAKVDPWVDAGAPCPKWRFFKRPGRLQPGQLQRR